MAVFSESHHIRTDGPGEIIDLSAHCAAAVEASGIADGLLVAFVAHSTCAVTTMEFEPGAVADLSNWLDKYIPPDRDYRHNVLNHDTNAHSHLRCAILGPGVSVPVVGGLLTLGTWQSPVLIECDDRGRQRHLVIQVLGD